MTVQELIQHLNTFPQDTEVMFSHVDHTDYGYKLDMDEKDIFLDDPTGENCEDMDDDLFDEEWNYIGPKVVVFNLDLEG